MPTSFHAVDLVEQGAATTALLSAYPDSLSDKDNQTTTATMDDFLTQLKAALQDPDIAAAVKAMHKSVTSAAAEDMSDDDMSAAMSAAGVTDADKAKEDETKPKTTRALLAIARASKRQIDSAAKSAAVEAEASFVKRLGKSGTAIMSAAKDGEDAETYITAQLSAGCKSRGAAIARMAKDKPDLYAKFENTRATHVAV